ncbi:unnamed protein product [Anisakis simplex]|uniref:DUF7516 domain-containing protein n=1 Tax=Anisakis simplex TaxID=6269 RepID=A0A158PPK7_ANISI|nr:unnamed protein product [Anisakis simplex]
MSVLFYFFRSNDWHLNPDRLAQIFGFANLDKLFTISSGALSDYIEVDLNDRNERVFRLKPIESIKHLQQILLSLEAAQPAKSIKIEKQCELHIAENRAAYIEGKRRLIGLMKELDGANTEIRYEQLQVRYQQRFGVQLSGQELARMFGTKKASKVFANEFQGEIDIMQQNPLMLMLFNDDVEGTRVNESLGTPRSIQGKVNAESLQKALNSRLTSDEVNRNSGEFVRHIGQRKSQPSDANETLVSNFPMEQSHCSIGSTRANRVLDYGDIQPAQYDYVYCIPTQLSHCCATYNLVYWFGLDQMRPVLNWIDKITDDEGPETGEDITSMFVLNSSFISGKSILRLQRRVEVSLWEGFDDVKRIEKINE